MACLKPGATSWPSSEASLEPVSVEARREWVGTGVGLMLVSKMKLHVHFTLLPSGAG